MRFHSLYRSVGGGLCAGLALWVLDLLRLDALRFAGASDEHLQGLLLNETLPAVVAFEVTLLSLHLVGGAGLGLLFGHARLGWSRGRPFLEALVGTLTLALLAWASTLIRYPQLFTAALSDGQTGVPRFWAPALTHTVGPWPFDVLFLGILFTLVVVAAYRHPRTYATAALLLGFSLGWNRWKERITAPPPGPKNVLILAIDSLRSDRITDPEVMPFVASLAQKGHLFTSAYVPIARTFPSWTSALTGREPRKTQVRTMFPRRAQRSEVGPTLFHTLADAGYHTFIVSDFAGDVFPRFDSGAEDVDAPTLTLDRLAQSALLSSHGFSLPALRLSAVRRLLDVWRNLPSLSDPDWLVAATRTQLARCSDRPFGGLVFFSTAHFPYPAPYPYYYPHDRQTSEHEGTATYAGRFLYQVPPNAAGKRTTPEEQRQVALRYDGGLRAIDDSIRQLFDQLSSAGLLQNTLVVFTSDHGEQLYEDGVSSGHGDDIDWIHTQRVPILLVDPDLPARRDHRTVRLLDLPATILHHLDLRGPETPFGEGISLLRPEQGRGACVGEPVQGFGVEEQSRGLRDEPQGQRLCIDERSREALVPEQSKGLRTDGQVRGFWVDEETQGVFVDEQCLGLRTDGRVQGLYIDDRSRGGFLEDHARRVCIDAQPRGGFAEDHARGLCVESGLWFFPDGPEALAGVRLPYPGIAELLTLEEGEMVLRPPVEPLTESAKFRGFVQGNQAFVLRPTLAGLKREFVMLDDQGPELTPEVLEALFWARCVDGDPRLERFFGSVVYHGEGED